MDFLIDKHLISVRPRSLFQAQSNDSLASPSVKSCLCDSTQSFLGEKFKTNLLINRMECDKCKNLILRQENRRCSMCNECVGKLYSPKTCHACDGRISFKDLQDSSIQFHANKKYFSDFSDPSNLRLCNCFPKYPSQHLSSFQTANPREVQILPNAGGKSSSCNELLLMQQKTAHDLSFYSQDCLKVSVTPNYSEDDDASSDED